MLTPFDECHPPPAIDEHLLPRPADIPLSRPAVQVTPEIVIAQLRKNLDELAGDRAAGALAPIREGGEPLPRDDWVQTALAKQQECIARLSFGVMFNIRQFDDFQRQWNEKNAQAGSNCCGHHVLQSDARVPGLTMRRSGGVNAGRTGTLALEEQAINDIDEECRKTRRSEF